MESWMRRIKDLNGDEVEDLLVFRFGHWDGDPMEDDALGNQEGRRIILGRRKQADCGTLFDG